MLKNMDDFDLIFSRIKNLLQKEGALLRQEERYLGSQAKDDKPGFHLYGKTEVSLFGKKPQPVYVAGVIYQKNYVSFYFSPVYSHPEEFLKDLSPGLKKFLKGKSCFNLKSLDDNMANELGSLLQKGISFYRQIEWI